MFKFLSNKRVFFKPTFSFHIHSNYESTYVYPQGENFVGTKSLDCIDDKNILQSRTGKIKFKLHFKREHLCFLFQYKSTSFHHKFLIFIWLQQELFPTDRNLDRIFSSPIQIYIYIYYFTLHYLKQSSHSFILTIKRVFIWRRATPLGRASLSKRAGFHLAFTWEKPTLAQPSHPG